MKQCDDLVGECANDLRNVAHSRVPPAPLWQVAYVISAKKNLQICPKKLRNIPPYGRRERFSAAKVFQVVSFRRSLQGGFADKSLLTLFSLKIQTWWRDFATNFTLPSLTQTSYKKRKRWYLLALRCLSLGRRVTTTLSIWQISTCSRNNKLLFNLHDIANWCWQWFVAILSVEALALKLQESKESGGRPWSCLVYINMY